MRSIGGVEYDVQDSKPLIAYQSLDYLRAFYNNRIAWSRLELHALRRRARSRCGGATSSTSSAAGRATTRARTSSSRSVCTRCSDEQGRPYRGLPPRRRRGHGRARTTVRKLVAQRERWQRVILETWWANRHMCFNRRYGDGRTSRHARSTSSRRSWPPSSSCVAITLLVVGAVSGHVEWWQFAGVTLAITLVNSVFNAGALLMVDLEARVYNERAARPALCADAAGAGRLPTDHGVGAAQGDVAVPPR